MLNRTLGQELEVTSACTDPVAFPPDPILIGISYLCAWMKKLRLSAELLPPQQHRLQLDPCSVLEMTSLHTVFPQILRP